MTLTPTDERALWDACEQQWEHHRRQFWRVYLPSQEWEDIRAKAFARVFSRVKRWDPAKGDLSTWSGTVIRRIMINEFRRSLPNLPCHWTRTNLQHAHPIRTCVAADHWGDEHIIVEPDLPCHQSALSDVDEFAQHLSGDERKVLQMLLAGATVRDVQRRLKLRNWLAAERRILHLGAKWGQLGKRRVAALPAKQPQPRADLPQDLMERVQRARAVKGTGKRGERPYRRRVAAKQTHEPR